MGYAEDGKQIMNNLVLGTGVGASATGLYYLAKKLRKRFEEQLEKNKPEAPDYNEIALEVPALPVVPQKKLAFDAYTVATPLAGGAAGAILAAALSDKKNKKRNALLGAGAGALAGAGLNTKPVHEFIGRNTFSSIFPFLNPIMGKAWFSRGSGYNGWNAAMNVTGGALGALGGKTLYDMAAAPYEEVEKKKEQYNNVESARNKYFQELLSADDEKSPDKKEKKANVTEMLDAAFGAYTEKSAAWYDYINPLKFPGLKQLFYDLPNIYGTTAVAATIGGGLLGGKYMYDKTRSESRAKNMAKALAAKERMKNTLPVWVDPQELAQVKDVAEAKAPTDVGV